MATFEPGAVLKEFEDNNFKLEDAAVGDACEAANSLYFNHCYHALTLTPISEF